jgi:hypothetical protein
LDECNTKEKNKNSSQWKHNLLIMLMKCGCYAGRC